MVKYSENVNKDMKIPVKWTELKNTVMALKSTL